MKDLDAQLEVALAKSKNLSIPWFLSTSVLYYQHEISALSDVRFDKLCHQMLEWWPKLVHRDKHFVKRSMLTAGTGFDLPWRKLPAIVFGSAGEMAKALQG